MPPPCLTLSALARAVAISVTLGWDSVAPIWSDPTVAAAVGRSMMEEARSLSLGVSVFLLVVGAILTFAVDVTASGFSINAVGIILMIAGALGLVLSLLFWSSFSPYRRGRTVVGGDTVVEERRIERDLP
jgi:Domain of unknown function (DUF6458)